MDILTVKANQCPEFVDALSQSGDGILIEDTNDEYCARGTTGHGSNILGELLMLLGDVLQSTSSSLQAYCPPSNGVTSPCYNCGEGNHNKDSCGHQTPLQC